MGGKRHGRAGGRRHGRAGGGVAVERGGGVTVGRGKASRWKGRLASRSGGGKADILSKPNRRRGAARADLVAGQAGAGGGRGRGADVHCRKRAAVRGRSEELTSELQSQSNLVCRL